MASMKNTTNKPFCSFCYNLGKPSDVYTSHYIRETPAPNSRVVCPELRKCVCTGCGKCGHTISRCMKYKKESRMGENIRHGIDAPYKNRHTNKPVEVLIKPKNIYDCLSDGDDSDSDGDTETISAGSVSSSVVTKNEVSMKSYAAALMTVLKAEPEPVVCDNDSDTKSKPKYDFSIFKNAKRYASWADTDSSDDEA